jgi:hypothetical protein
MMSESMGAIISERPGDFIGIRTLTAGAAAGRRQEPDFLVVADRRRIRACLLGQVSNLDVGHPKSSLPKPLEPQVT